MRSAAQAPQPVGGGIRPGDGTVARSGLPQGLITRFTHWRPSGQARRSHPIRRSRIAAGHCQLGLGAAGLQPAAGGQRQTGRGAARIAAAVGALAEDPGTTTGRVRSQTGPANRAIGTHEIGCARRHSAFLRRARGGRVVAGADLAALGVLLEAELAEQPARHRRARRRRVALARLAALGVLLEPVPAEQVAGHGLAHRRGIAAAGGAPRSSSTLPLGQKIAQTGPHMGGTSVPASTLPPVPPVCPPVPPVPPPPTPPRPPVCPPLPPVRPPAATGLTPAAAPAARCPPPPPLPPAPPPGASAPPSVPGSVGSRPSRSRQLALATTQANRMAWRRRMVPPHGRSGPPTRPQGTCRPPTPKITAFA